MSLTEFEIIERYFKQDVANRPDVIRGSGDDAAILRVPEGQDLVVSTDTLVSGTHFPTTMNPGDIGYRSLAVNLSDLAAMGAEARWLTLALTLPQADEHWLSEFSEGLMQLATQQQIALVGGDITRGPLSITVQVLGVVPRGSALQRCGARPGDLLYVTGTLGGPGLALEAIAGRSGYSANLTAALMQRFNRPEPRLAAGLVLRDLASSAIDISDGLLADLGHILAASQAGAVVRIDTLPLFATGEEVSRDSLLQHALVSGDEYELCFTIAPSRQGEMVRQLAGVCPVRCIGEITDGAGLRCVDGKGRVCTPAGSGYRHF